MESVFISSNEVSENFIDSNETISDSNNSSTSYVPTAFTASEEYTNQVGGDHHVEEQVKAVENAAKQAGQAVSEVANEVSEAAGEVVNAVVPKEQQKQIAKATKNVQDAAQKAVDAVVPQETQKQVEQGLNNASKAVADFGSLLLKGVKKGAQKIDEDREKKEMEIRDKIKDMEKDELIEIIVNGCKIPEEHKKEQQGGAYNSRRTRIYYEKYLKYKLKYLELKYD